MRRALVLMLAALAVLGAASALPGCGCQEQALESTTGKIDVAKDAALKSQLMLIDTGIKAAIASNGALPSHASQATLGSFVAPWPVNPHTNAPMQPGDKVGDYAYSPQTGTSYSLSVKLSDGSTYSAN